MNFIYVRLAGALTASSLFATLASAATTLTFTPASLSFPVTNTGSTSAAVMTTVKNTGTTSASISSIAIGGDDTADFKISAKTCTTTLAAAASCTVSVTFSPITSGIRAASLTFTDNATGSPQSVSLQGSGQSTTPGIGFFPTSIGFPATAVGTTSSNISTQVTNYSATTVSITAVHLQGTNAGQFVIASNNCSSITQGNSCSVAVNFSPTTAGIAQASLEFTDTATGSPQTVPLVGTAEASTLSITVSPTSSSFGTVNIGSTTNSTYFAIFNAGTSAVSFTSATLTGTNAADFSITSQTNCINGGVINANQTCYVYVSFTPSAAGVRTATLNITDNATGSPQKATLYGVGQASASTLSLSRGTLDLGVEPVGVTSGQTYVSVQNTGTTPVAFTSVALAGTNAADFSITSNGCSGTLNPLNTCNEYVNFTPSSTGQRTATLSFTDSATGSPQSVTLAGTGETQTESLSFNYLDYGFGQLVVGATSNTYYESVYNAGDVPVTFSSIAITGTNAPDFTITSQGCPIAPSTLAPTQTCYVYTNFAPSASGVRTAALTFTDSVTGSPQSIGLGGLGLAQTQTLSFSVPNFAFPGVAVGSSTGGQTVTVMNTGDEPVTFNSVTLTGAGAASFSITSNGCSGLTPSQSCNVTVDSAPIAAGVQTASLSFNDTATGSPQAIPLAGDGEPATPALSASVGDVNFGDGVVGTATTPTTITMTNSSSSAVTISFSVVGPNPSDFVVSSNTCTGSLGGSASCTLKVAFDATALGSRVAALRFTVASVSQDVLVAGVGSSASKLLTLQTAVDFGSATVTTASAQHAVSVQNTGAVPVNITAYTIAGADPSDFSVASNTCGAILAPDVTCDVNLIFTPTAAGERTGTLQVSDSATGSPQSVGLSGVGQTNLLSLTLPPSVDLGTTVSGSPVVANVLVDNSGTSAVTISKVAISGTNASDFLVTYNPCSNINTSSSCNIEVTFNPTGVGVRTATLTLTDTAAGSPQTVTLVGVGQAAVATLAVPAALAFPAVNLGTYANLNLTLQNTGTVTISVTGIALTGSAATDYTAYNSCQSIAPATTCNLLIAFVPGAAGLRVASLSITDNATGSPQKISLTGFGLALAPTINIPQDLAFPAVTVGSYLVQSFPIYNTGNTLITFTNTAIGGTNATDFQLLGGGCPTLYAGQGCTVYVAFTPVNTGTRQATLTFTGNAAGSPQSVLLTGIGQAKTSSASLTPSALTFSAQTVGTVSGGQYMYVTNSGALPVTVSKVAIGGTDPVDFQIIYNTCAGVTLTQNQYCYVEVAFTPTATGARTATLTATDNGIGGAQTGTLTGTGQ